MKILVLGITDSNEVCRALRSEDHTVTQFLGHGGMWSSEMYSEDTSESDLVVIVPNSPEDTRRVVMETAAVTFIPIVWFRNEPADIPGAGNTFHVGVLRRNTIKGLMALVASMGPSGVSREQPAQEATSPNYYTMAVNNMNVDVSEIQLAALGAEGYQAYIHGTMIAYLLRHGRKHKDRSDMDKAIRTGQMGANAAAGRRPVDNGPA